MAHSDSTLLTLLTTFNFPGLQVKIDDEFVSVRPQRNMLIVNLGDIMARMSGNKVKSTVHQVLDIGCTR